LAARQQPMRFALQATRRFLTIAVCAGPACQHTVVRMASPRTSIGSCVAAACHIRPWGWFDPPSQPRTIAEFFHSL
jgi:hypothetical protein